MKFSCPVSAVMIVGLAFASLAGLLPFVPLNQSAALAAEGENNEFFPHGRTYGTRTTNGPGSAGSRHFNLDGDDSHRKRAISSTGHEGFAFEAPTISISPKTLTGEVDSDFLNNEGSIGSARDGGETAPMSLETILKLFPRGSDDAEPMKSKDSGGDESNPQFGGLNQTLERIRRIREKLTENRAVPDKRSQFGVSPSGRPEFRTDNGRPPAGRKPYEVERDETGREGYYDEKGNYFKGLPLHLLDEGNGSGQSEKSESVLFPTGKSGSSGATGGTGGSELFPR